MKRFLAHIELHEVRPHEQSEIYRQLHKELAENAFVSSVPTAQGYLLDLPAGMYRTTGPDKLTADEVAELANDAVQATINWANRRHKISTFTGSVLVVAYTDAAWRGLH